MPPSTGATLRPTATIAFFTANPTSLAELDLTGEIRAIGAELEKVGLADVLQFLPCPAAAPADLQRMLLAKAPDVVQFSGHGHGSNRGGGRGQRTTREMALDEELGPARTPRERTGIAMQGDRPDDVKVVSGEALGRIFSALGERIRLVVLNACHSAEQAAALLEHVDFVIGIDGEIQDEAAKVFTAAFYRALAHGRTIQACFDLGIDELMAEGLELDVPLPRLESRAGADPKQVALVAAPTPEDASTWDLYLSYAKADRNAARKLAVALRGRKLRVFFDEWEIDRGEVRSLRLEDGLRDSLHGIIALSSTTMTEPWVRQQYAVMLDKAVEHDRLLIPALIGEGELEPPPFLAIRHPADLRVATQDDYDSEIDAITRGLRKRLRS